MKLLRILLCVALVLAPIESALAAAGCSIDGAFFAGVYFDPVTTTKTIAIATTQRDEIVLHISIVSESGGSFTYPSVVSVNGGSLAWSRRQQEQDMIPSCYSGGTCYADVEEWTALASGPVSAVVTVVAMAPAPSYSSLLAIGVAGSLGFDANSSLPAVNKNLTTSSLAVTVPGISTNSSPDMLLFTCDQFGSNPYGGFGCQATGGTTAPWNLTTGGWQGNIFIGFGLQTEQFQRALGAPVSGITAQPFTTAQNQWIATADALVCTTASAHVNVQIIE